MLRWRYGMNYGNNLGYLLNKAARMTKWDFNSRLADEGITSTQWGLIRDIYLNEKLCSNEEEKFVRLSPASIAERLQSDRPTVSCMIERLVRQDLAYRISNPKDRRSQEIMLTDKAKQLMPKLEALSDSTIARAVKGLTEEDIGRLKNYLTRIIDNLASQESKENDIKI
jgi:MarR family transcriptional regulator for hemolysin